MKSRTSAILSLLITVSPSLAADKLPLPPGVPRTVDTNGEVINVDFTFTTPEYQKAAFDLVLQEANRVAVELGLSESRPITESNVVHAFISPFGFVYAEKAVGNITTSNYWYNFKQDCKFSDLTADKMDARCRDYAAKHQWPIERLDTNAAFQLATQWLTAARMDVQGLNRDCDVRINLNPYWNNVKMGELPKRKFTPIYYVSWLRKNREPDSVGSEASVELFLPAKTLLSLSVNDSKYILRPPLVFTNLAALFPGKGKVTTNYPSEPIIVDGGAP